MLDRARAFLGILAATFVQAAAQSAWSQSPSLEYGVKANYLVRFAAFVEWPPTAFVASTTPVTLCVAGRDPFGRALDQAAAGQTAHGRRILVLRPDSPAAADGCHILYAGPAADPAYLTPRRSRLLVTEAGSPGMIAFVIRDRRVRFEIDQAAARQAGLVMSSRLLGLAVSVRGR
jgi:hypothetical protein